MVLDSIIHLLFISLVCRIGVIITQAVQRTLSQTDDYLQSEMARKNTFTKFVS